VTTVGGRLEAIVLAAGGGVRFGGAKLTAPWRGRALIDGALDAALAAPVRSVWLVTGADPRVIRVGAVRQDERLNFVHARDHALGMAASLRAGLATLPPDTAAAFVFLGDMPLIPRGIPARLAKTLGGSILASAPVCGGRRGHPVLFTAKLFPSLAALEGDEGGRRILEPLGSRLALVETDDAGVLFDVDTRDQ